MAMIDVYSNGQRVAALPAVRGDRGPKGDKGDPGSNGMTVIPMTESQYAAIRPESGVLYIVTADS